MIDDDDVFRKQKRFSLVDLALMKRSVKTKLLFALQNTPQPPCTDCGWWDTCATEHLACECFKRYVEDEKRLRVCEKFPNAEIYKQIYQADNNQGEK